MLAVQLVYPSTYFSYLLTCPGTSESPAAPKRLLTTACTHARSWRSGEGQPSTELASTCQRPVMCATSARQLSASFPVSVQRDGST